MSMTPDDLRQRAIYGGVEERLVYADWLEERGEPLGELIRLACSLQSKLPNYLGGTGTPLAKRFREIYPAVLAPIVQRIDEAWPKCGACKGFRNKRNALANTQPEYTRLVLNSNVWNLHDYKCQYCQGLGRVGKLWRDCPDLVEAKELGKVTKHDCTRCSGFGVLLEVPCKRCNELDNAGIQGLCHGCQGVGYIRSPIADLHELLALTYDPRADDVRRCDTTVLLSFLNSQN